MSEKFKVIITPVAQDDIRNSVMYIAHELANPQAAIALQNEFRKEITSLETMPSRYKVVDEQPWGALGVRKVKVKNHYVYYVTDDENKTVSVIAVIYVRMDQQVQVDERIK